MRFVDRSEEMARLDGLAASEDGGLAVFSGRRRIGKTRLLLEWSARHGGLESIDGERVLLGEAKWSSRPFSKAGLERARRELVSKPGPSLPSRYARCEVVRALFVPELAGELAIPTDEIVIVTGSDLTR